LDKTQRTLDYRILVPIYNNYSRGIILDDLVNDYNLDMPFKDLSEKYNVSHVKMLQIFEEFNIPKRERIQFRQSFSYKKIKTPPYLFSLIQDKELYKLNACYCDYFAKKADSLVCFLIEEKTTFSKFNHTSAALQLLLGEQIIKENTELNIIKKIIFAHNLGKNNDTFNPHHFIDDFKKYLDIETIIVGEGIDNVCYDS